MQKAEPLLAQLVDLARQIGRDDLIVGALGIRDYYYVLVKAGDWCAQVKDFRFEKCVGSYRRRTFFV